MGWNHFFNSRNVVGRMSQKDLVLSLHEEGLTAKEIYEPLVEIFGPLAMPCSTVTRTVMETCWIPSEERSQNVGGRPRNLHHDARFLSVLHGNPNASVREIAHKTRIPKPIVFGILRLRLKYFARNCRLVPHALTETQRKAYVKKSTALLSVLTKAKRCAWQFIITDDEFCLFSYAQDSKIWLPADADTPEMAKRLINTLKMMTIIFWNPFGIHVLAALPEKTSFDAEYFLNYVLAQLKSFLLCMRAQVKSKHLSFMWTIH
jgi:hypothetical protein